MQCENLRCSNPGGAILGVVPCDVSGYCHLRKFVIGMTFGFLPSAQ